EEIKAAYIEVSSELGQAELSFKEILKLAPGDVIPLDVPEELTLFAESVPILKGTFGDSNGKNALKITGKANRKNS
ncbi:MAG TPA: flagellar motor switch protein FliM, partial [Porticoccaceae bacterium]|nr:flagellar motor switch protein FliM [Porticoccaceae bacterium]